MTDTNLNPNHDAYAPLAERLRSGDAVNGWLVSRPRRRIAQLLKGQRVLDVGCGTGTLTAMLAAAGCQAVGVDGSPTMISFAQRKHIPAEFRLIDATRMPFDREFDAAVISLALHEMPPHVRELVWDSMRRAVRPQGRLITLDFTVPRRNNLFARIARSLIERDERSFVTVHREHYENFSEFMRNGGLRAWIQTRREPLESEYDYLGGTLAVMICRRTVSSDGT
jgi:ubiquinone/menaquinone biosynthesis C-methylase UbiE